MARPEGWRRPLARAWPGGLSLRDSELAFGSVRTGCLLSEVRTLPGAMLGCPAPFNDKGPIIRRGL